MANAEIKETVEIHDAENTLFSINIEIKKGKLSITGDYGGGGGQCQDHIKPANKEQRWLIEIWNAWHLNDMHSGTERQEAALKDFKPDNGSQKSRYEQECEFLKKRRLYTDHGYKYGTAWKMRELPGGLDRRILRLCAVLREQEAARKQKLTGGSWSEDASDQLKALAASLGLSPKEAEADISDGYDSDHLRHCGTDYLVADEETVREKCRDYLDKDMWIECIKSDRTTESLEDWQETVMNGDGYGSILNSHDGTEDTQEIDGKTWYIIQN
jgi:hypothetical protein